MLGYRHPPVPGERRGPADPGRARGRRTPRHHRRPGRAVPLVQLRALPEVFDDTAKEFSAEDRALVRDLLGPEGWEQAKGELAWQPQN
jgi:hypothetical protein